MKLKLKDIISINYVTVLMKQLLSCDLILYVDVFPPETRSSETLMLISGELYLNEHVKETVWTAGVVFISNLFRVIVSTLARAEAP